MAGGYSRTRKGSRTDLPSTIKFRSSWDANLYRVLSHLHEQGYVPYWEYDTFITLIFPGKADVARGTSKYNPDYFTICCGDIYELLTTGVTTSERVQPAWLEPKGRLKSGGWLLDITDFSSLDAARDSASRIKLERLKRYYPGVAPRTLVLGAREWSLIEKQWKKIIPNWE